MIYNWFQLDFLVFPASFIIKVFRLDESMYY